jgi:transcriptional regulator with XRE-family HTH domain
MLTLAEKVQHLREVEGQLRGLGRPLSKSEVVRCMRSELGEGLSLPYLSQIESGTRPHLTASSRELLARFFRVHPSYLVSDPEGFEETLSSSFETQPAELSDWLARRAEEQRGDPEVYEALLRLASLADPRAGLVRVGQLIAAGALVVSPDSVDSSAGVYTGEQS